MRCVEREAQLRDALAPVEEVAPVPADRREEDAAGAHPQHGRHVLDQRRDAPREAGVGVEAQETLDGFLVERAVELVGRLRDEQVQGQYRRADGGGELRTPLEAGARFVVQAVDGDERAARPGQRSLGRNDHVQALQCALRDLDRARQGALRRDVGGVQAELDPVPGAALQAVGELVSLGRGLEQKASRHRSVQPPRADGRRRVATGFRPRLTTRVALVLARSQRPSGSLDRHRLADGPDDQLGRAAQRGRAAARERDGLVPRAVARDRLERGYDVVDVHEVTRALGVALDHDRPAGEGVPGEARDRTGGSLRGHLARPEHRGQADDGGGRRVQAARVLAQALGERVDVGRRLHGRPDRRRVDEAGTVGGAGLEQVHGRARVLADRPHGVLARTRGVGDAGEMQDRLAPGDEVADLAAAGVELDRVEAGCARPLRPARPGDRDDLVTLLAQQDRRAPPEEPGRARDQQLHLEADSK